MTVCKGCGKAFHACGSCDLLAWEWNFCSLACWIDAREKVKAELREIVACIPPDKRKLLANEYCEDYHIEVFWELLEEK